MWVTLINGPHSSQFSEIVKRIEKRKWRIYGFLNGQHKLHSFSDCWGSLKKLYHVLWWMVFHPDTMTKMEEACLRSQKIGICFLPLHLTSYWMILHSKRRWKSVGECAFLNLCQHMGHAFYILIISWGILCGSRKIGNT